MVFIPHIDAKKAMFCGMWPHHFRQMGVCATGSYVSPSPAPCGRAQGLWAGTRPARLRRQGAGKLDKIAAVPVMSQNGDRTGRVAVIGAAIAGRDSPAVPAPEDHFAWDARERLHHDPFREPNTVAFHMTACTVKLLAQLAGSTTCGPTRSRARNAEPRIASAPSRVSRKKPLISVTPAELSRTVLILFLGYGRLLLLHCRGYAPDGSTHKRRHVDLACSDAILPTAPPISTVTAIDARVRLR
jgi:hypothetical protein